MVSLTLSRTKSGRVRCSCRIHPLACNVRLANALGLDRHIQFADLQTGQHPKRLAGNSLFSARDELETLGDVEAPKLRHGDGRLGEEPQVNGRSRRGEGYCTAPGGRAG